MHENGMLRKIRLISKFMTSQPREQANAINVLPNTSKSKDNQTTKIGQLIEYNIGNIFLENAYTKCGGETIPRLFSRKPRSQLTKYVFFFAIFSLQTNVTKK